MDGNLIKQNIEKLERARMVFVPNKFIRKFITNTRDLVKEKLLLQSMAFDPESVHYLTRLIIDDLESNMKFQRIQCIQIFLRILKKRISSEPFSKIQMTSLFSLYKHVNGFGNDELKHAFTEAISGQELQTDDIEWLVEQSEHDKILVDLLLSYPVKNNLITSWALNMFAENKLQNRMAEVIGLLIEDDLPELIDPISTENEIIMWAIYHSHCSRNKKRKLILKYMNYENYLPALEVASKLGIGKISNELLKYYQLKQENNQAADCMLTLNDVEV